VVVHDVGGMLKAEHVGQHLEERDLRARVVTLWRHCEAWRNYMRRGLCTSRDRSWGWWW
jgi:hypothetical protein